jgi:hypothetical protein
MGFDPEMMIGAGVLRDLIKVQKTPIAQLVPVLLKPYHFPILQ